MGCPFGMARTHIRSAWRLGGRLATGGSDLRMASAIFSYACRASAAARPIPGNPTVPPSTLGRPSNPAR